MTLNFLVAKGDDTRTLLRFNLVGDKAVDLKLNDRRTQDFIALLKKKGTVVDATMTAFEAQYTQRQGQPSPSYVMVAANLPAVVQRGFLSAEVDMQRGYAGLPRVDAEVYAASGILTAAYQPSMSSCAKPTATPASARWCAMSRPAGPSSRPASAAACCGPAAARRRCCTAPTPAPACPSTATAMFIDERRQYELRAHHSSNTKSRCEIIVIVAQLHVVSKVRHIVAHETLDGLAFGADLKRTSRI